MSVWRFMNSYTIYILHKYRVPPILTYSTIERLIRVLSTHMWGVNFQINSEVRNKKHIKLIGQKTKREEREMKRKKIGVMRKFWQRMFNGSEKKDGHSFNFFQASNWELQPFHWLRNFFFLLLLSFKNMVSDMFL